VHQPTATWNPARGVWETTQENLLCGHLEPYSQTWPISGSMRNGAVWERPTLEPPTVDTGCSSPPGLLGAPQARDAKGAPGDGFNEGNLARQVSLLPTPQATNNENRQSEGYGPNLGAALSLLPTPKAGDAEFGLPRTSGRPPERATHLATRLHYTDFGDYTAAIERWEFVTGHAAPPPTEPSPRGNPRLSPAFVEWMMGLPAGHVTGTGISRVAQLTALGNGVVPHQAAAAIRLLLERASRDGLGNRDHRRRRRRTRHLHQRKKETTMTDDVLEWSARIDQAIEEYPEVQEYLDAIRGNIEALTARMNAVRELVAEFEAEDIMPVGQVTLIRAAINGD